MKFTDSGIVVNEVGTPFDVGIENLTKTIAQLMKERAELQELQRRYRADKTIKLMGITLDEIHQPEDIGEGENPWLTLKTFVDKLGDELKKKRFVSHRGDIIAVTAILSKDCTSLGVTLDDVVRNEKGEETDDGSTTDD